MSVFEIEGLVKKEVECDIANITITFRATGRRAHEVSSKVMDQCDSFLEEISKTGVDLKDIHLDEDNVETARYDDDGSLRAERAVELRIPFDMKRINQIHAMLQKGMFDYTISIGGDISNRQALLTELAKEALNNSKNEAEQLAEVLGIKVKGIESIRKDGWDDDFVYDRCCDDGECECERHFAPRRSDEIGAKMTEESVRLKVKWILEG